MFKICFYVPVSHAEAVKQALFDKGAGKIGPYQHCAWQVLGEGQFMPLADSNAYIGEADHIEKIPEYKIEMVCQDEEIKEVVAALKKTHPYEQPAYQVWRLYEC